MKKKSRRKSLWGFQIPQDLQEEGKKADDGFWRCGGVTVSICFYIYCFCGSQNERVSSNHLQRVQMHLQLQKTCARVTVPFTTHLQKCKSGSLLSTFTKELCLMLWWVFQQLMVVVIVCLMDLVFGVGVNVVATRTSVFQIYDFSSANFSQQIDSPPRPFPGVKSPP